MTTIHQKSHGRRLIVAVGALVTLAAASRSASAEVASDRARLPAQVKSSAFFEPNLGQAPTSVRFLSRGATQNLEVANDGLWFPQAGGERVGLTFVGAKTLEPTGAQRLVGVSNYRRGGPIAGAVTAPTACCF